MTPALLALTAALAVLVYTWVAYPLLLRLRREPPPWASRRHRPFLSVIVAAADEARWIRSKIESTLQQAYPPGRLEIIVVSDGSTDGTDALVAGFGDPRVRLVRQEPRAGKSLALNRGVAVARGDVLVFTDANALFAPEALARLTAPMADPRVGLVAGQGLYRAGEGADARAVAGAYVRYEACVKAGEARAGFVAGVDGAIYALRRELYQDLEPAEVNDLLHPITVALAGRLTRFAADAVTVEPPSAGGGQELRRHVRIVAQNMHLLWRWLPRLVRAGRWREAAMLVSHRVLRWTTAPCLAVALVANVALLDHGVLARAALAAQLAFHALALTGWAAERAGLRLGFLAAPYYLWVVAVAALGGLVRFLRGRADAVWAPGGRTPISRRAA